MFLKLLDVFFILYFLFIFITFYSVYTFIDIKVFRNTQGSKLEIKKTNLIK